VQEEKRPKQEKTGAKEKELGSPRMKLLRVHHKRNKIKVTIVSFAVSLDMYRRNVANIMLGVQRNVCFLLWSVLRSV